MHALSRPATDKEINSLTKNPMMIGLPNSKTQPTPQFWSNYHQDIMWALLNSNEFILNH
jgi:hypothetical protein